MLKQQSGTLLWKCKYLSILFNITRKVKQNTAAFYSHFITFSSLTASPHFSVTCTSHLGTAKYWTGILPIWSLPMLHHSPHFHWNTGIKMTILSSQEAIIRSRTVTPAFRWPYLRAKMLNWTPWWDRWNTVQQVRNSGMDLVLDIVQLPRTTDNYRGILHILVNYFKVIKTY